MTTSTTGNAFTSQTYAPRAQDYVTSLVHASGDDLDQIEAEVKAEAPRRVLDLGCGGGHVSYRAARHAEEVVACDVTQAMLDAVQAAATERGLTNIRTQQAPAERLPFKDGEFDMVLCRFTTHHWENMNAGLGEARRVLKRGGRAVFVDSVAAANPVLDSHLQAIELLRDASHVRNYTVSEWVGGLGRAGFAVEGLVMRHLRMDFPVWAARTRTPPHYVTAIRALQEGAPASVRDYFAIEPDGSFDLAVATFQVQAV